MQMEALKVFCDVARFRSFSQAAQANHVTQSAASQVVLQLERRLNAQLVDRSTRPLQLTAIGQKYYEGCKTVIDQLQELEASIRHEQILVDATVQVAAIYSVGLSDMGHYVERFRHVRPQSVVNIEYLHPDRVHAKVMDGTADLGLVSFPKKTRELACLPWRDEEIVLACPPGHPLTHQRTVSIHDLARHRYVGFTRELTIRREIDRFLREADVAVDPVMEFDNVENIKKAVEVNAGVALLPEPTFRREVEAGTLVAMPLAGARLHRPLGIIQRRHHKLSSAARDFIALLREPKSSSHPLVNGSASVNGAAKLTTRSRREYAKKP